LPGVDAPADPRETKVPPRRRKRPIAVTFVGVLAVGGGLYYLIEGGIRVSDGGSAGRLAAGAVDLALGVLALAIGRGAFRAATWAWAALMTWAAFGLTHELLRHFFYSDASFLSLAIDATIVLAVTPLDIQVEFGVRRRPGPAVASDRSAGERVG
jgi:hypothetical protein